MMMVDGRTPLLGSNRALALASIKNALKEPPGVAITLAMKGGEGTKTLTTDLAILANGAMGRELLVGVAVVADSVTTKVLSGENAGKTLVEPFTVRSFAYKMIRPERTGRTTLTFPLSL